MNRGISQISAGSCTGVGGYTKEIETSAMANTLQFSVEDRRSPDQVLCTICNSGWHETAAERLYAKLHPTMRFENRRSCLQALKQIGHQVGAGFMVGLPGQTAEDLAEDLFYLKELEPDMVGIGPFIRHSETPLKEATSGTVEDTLVMVALTRLLIPDSLLPATTALRSLHPRGRELALLAGANVVMPNLTPTRLRKLYELYENKICLEDNPFSCRFCLETRINSAGFEADFGRGDSVRFEHKQKQKTFPVRNTI